MRASVKKNIQRLTFLLTFCVKTKSRPNAFPARNALILDNFRKAYFQASNRHCLKSGQVLTFFHSPKKVTKKAWFRLRWFLSGNIDFIKCLQLETVRSRYSRLCLLTFLWFLVYTLFDLWYIIFVIYDVKSRHSIASLSITEIWTLIF